MIQIFLAITNNKHIQLITGEIETMFGEEKVNVVQITKEEEVPSHLAKSFSYFFIDHSLLTDLQITENGKEKGRIYYIHPAPESLSEFKQGSIEFFPTCQQAITQFKFDKIKDTEKTGSSVAPPENEISVQKNNGPIDGESIGETDRGQQVNNDADDPNVHNPVYIQKPYKKITNIIDSTAYEDSDIVQRGDEYGQVFKGVKQSRNKAIGFWSPLQQVGVTTILMNFAIYFKKRNPAINVGVLEGLNKYPAIKDKLEAVQKPPENWHSYFHGYRKKGLKASDSIWEYQRVSWLPLNRETDLTSKPLFPEDNDNGGREVKWNGDILYQYIHQAKYYEMLFVDLQTADLERYTLDALHQLDELWVVINGNKSRINPQKPHLKAIAKHYNLTIKLIFVQATLQTQEEEMAQYLGFPLIAKIPILSEEINKNYSQNEFLIEDKLVARKLKEPFDSLLNHLLDEENTSPSKNSWLSKAFTIFQ